MTELPSPLTTLHNLPFPQLSQKRGHYNTGTFHFSSESIYTLNVSAPEAIIKLFSPFLTLMY